uniref:ShKT domain-containing protein n=1 Tax=Panagrolaimus sp. ES5 TaxID=591445 RepID=A0AC34F5X7_9BILA
MIKFLLFAYFIGSCFLIEVSEAQNLVCLPTLVDSDGTLSCPTTLTLNTTTNTCCYTDTNGCSAALLENGVYICPATLTLTDAVLCCNSSSTTTNTTCRDLVGPRGYSDCPARAYLCNNTVYYTLMTQQCPRTCGRCTSTTSNATSTSTIVSTTCVDLAASGRTSDCANQILQ